jgi:hypothetical protein
LWSADATTSREWFPDALTELLTPRHLSDVTRGEGREQ